MKRLCLLVALLWLIPSPGGAQIRIAPGTVDMEGVLRFDYPSADTPAIVCAPALTCILQLQNGEEIQNMGSADSVKRIPNGWLITSGHQGSTPIVYLTPQTAQNVGNLIITTTRHLYGVYLVASASTPHWRYGFTYHTRPLTTARAPQPTPALPATGGATLTAPPVTKPQAPGTLPVPGTLRQPTVLSAGPTTASPQPVSPPSAPFAQVAPTPTEAPTPLATPDANYVITGNAPFRPVSVTRDNGVMLIELPPGDYAWPAIKTFVGSSLSPVPETPDTTDPHRLVVQGIYDVLVLWTNDGGTERDVYISYGHAYEPTRHR